MVECSFTLGERTGYHVHWRVAVGWIEENQGAKTENKEREREKKENE